MRKFLCLLILTAFSFILLPRSAFALDISAKGYVLLEADSTYIVCGKNEHTRLPMASTTKIMTALVAIESCDITKEVSIPREAVGVEGSSIYLYEGEKLTLQDLLYAMLLESANDAATAIAIEVGGSVENFAEMMNKTAHSLGLKSTTFKNASGLHNPDQVTTAQDMAILAMAMIHHFPHHYKLFSKRTFTYKGRTYRSHNHVQKKYKGAEGLKTGYISAVGYNIISTAKRNNNRLVSVVIGQDTVALRDRQAMNLLDKGFSRIKKHKTSENKDILNKNAILEIYN